MAKPKKRFSKAVFIEDIDKRIRARSHYASSQRKGSARWQANEAVVLELQDLRKKLVGSKLKLDE